jgi:hypothetical protein
LNAEKFVWSYVVDLFADIGGMPAKSTIIATMTILPQPLQTATQNTNHSKTKYCLAFHSLSSGGALGKLDLLNIGIKMSNADTTSNGADCAHGDTHGSFSRPFSTAHSEAPFAIGERFHETGFSQSIDVQQPQNAPLAQMQSKYQDIRVYSNPHYGKILVLDGVLQITERDGDSYNEMMAHIPMMEHPNPKKVLVLGGGDGYVVSEVRFSLTCGLLLATLLVVVSRQM